MKKILVISSMLISATALPDSNVPCNLKNWGLCNSHGSSVRAKEAWSVIKPSAKVVVAVVDTGIDANHVDLHRNMWHEDGGDVYGWNYVADQPNPFDNHGHGTHVAGIIAGKYDPKNGMAGVAPGVSVMAVKYYSESNPGSVNLKNTVKALNYAVDHDADIINYSGGGPEFNEDEYLALKRAEEKGIIVIVAAGNEHEDTDLVENYYYPSAYRLSNIISVASLDINNNLLPSSNWGKTHVDVAAPGENIYSTLPGGHYGYMTGTSQATAFVSGIAALLKSCNKRLTPTQIKSVIFESVHTAPQLYGKVFTAGRVDAYKAASLARKRFSCVKR